MNNYSRYIALAIFIAFVSVFTLGCKENSIIGTNVLPKPNNDTEISVPLPVLATTVYDGSVNTGLNNGEPIYHALGTYNDPVFGKTNAGIYFQIIPTILGSNFSGSTIDSAVLVLPYSGFTYGNTTDYSLTQTYTVYKVLPPNPFGVNIGYTPDQAIPVDMVNPLSAPTIVNVNRTFNLSDSIPVNGINEPSHLRIKLNNNFVNLFSNAQNSANFSDYPTFLNWFNGIYIQSSDTNQAISALPYFRLDGVDVYSEANIQVYYHTHSLTPDTPLITSYYFIPTTCGHGNKMSRVYQPNFISNYFSLNYQVNNTVALQAPPGAALDIKIPMKKGGVPIIPTSVINKAELSITCNNFDAFCPPNLNVTGINDSNNTFYIIQDFYPTYSSSPLEVLDGTPHNINGSTTYILNIPRELLNAVQSNKDTLHLRINATNGYYNYPGAYRMIGSDIKMNIVYSTLK